MCSHPKLRKAVVRSALLLSLILTCALCFAGPYSDLKHRLDQAKTDNEVIRLVASKGGINTQREVTDAIRAHVDGFNDSKTASRLRAIVDLGAMGESSDPSANVEQRQAREIKQSPFYKDQGIDRKRNWLADALDRLKNIHFDIDSPHSSGPRYSYFGPDLGFLIWVALAAGVIVLLYYALKHVNWQATLKRKTKAMLEEDEPDRTLDEWLQLADHHAGAGRYREAVRALYLACLLKFDEADIARFDRGETNWEHLERIEESPKKPADLDFRTPTQRFDRVWYGYQTDGLPDVERFREWYRQVSDALKGVPA